MTRRQWRDLSPWQRTMTLVLAPVEVALTVAAAVDLARRPAGKVHGPKELWWLGIVVQPVGPVAYLTWGRHA
jgi:hypothetical protein